MQRAYADAIAIGGGRTTHLFGHRRKDGSTFPVELLRHAVRSDGRWIIVAIARDITARVEAEQSLRRSEARFRSLTALSSDGYWETDAQHRFVTAVTGGRFTAAYMANDQIGKKRWELPNTAPDAAGWARHAAIMDAHQSFLDFDIARAIPGGKIAHLSISGEPMFDDQGGFIGFQGIARDITARKEYEARLLEINAELEARVVQRTAELERSNRELEAFSYSVAHDLRAPLRAISGFSAIVLEQNEGKLDAASVGYLRRVQAGGEHMGELVDDLLDLARISRREVRRQELNLGEVAGKVLAALTEAHPERKVRIEVNAHMRANGDAGLIEIALVNLIGNAWKFTGKVADARIEVGTERRDGQNVYFVRDNGVGFDMAYTKNLFAPFQRLHHRDDFEGTGIGFSLVKRIIDKHDGKIWAEGEKGKGARFYFTLD